MLGGGDQLTPTAQVGATARHSSGFVGRLFGRYLDIPNADFMPRNYKGPEVWLKGSE